MKWVAWALSLIWTAAAIFFSATEEKKQYAHMMSTIFLVGAAVLTKLDDKPGAS
jgi:uncharacterized membrane protein YphA (DoxX/SURF4 family)